ncbi:MAG TPA: sulfur carrier protein ThiS adenylyltransferase ThiF [Spirochaetia bacterium]|nr:MAG: thiamine biosynthesis protein ThiF [Spirochaetes bacterium GWB1_36_13]HCL57176.1 sulfur carrier protein ThiS adenylyltransferase ThiF [Spirochaetia bacterium]
MTVSVNGKKKDLGEGEFLLEALKLKLSPDSDIIIYNGFCIDDLSFPLKDGDSVFFIKRGDFPGEDELEALMMSRHTPLVFEKLKKSTVGIAGLGGLGSNCAVSLARVGVGTLILADFDIVEPSNLNRQQYFIDQLGMFKTEAIKETLTRINPYLKIITHTLRLNETNTESVFQEADILIEAFDRVEAKTMIIKEASRMKKIIIAASGMAGYGENDLIQTRKINDDFYIIGDMEKESRPGQGLMAPRVMIAAAKQANLAVEILVEKNTVL